MKKASTKAAAKKASTGSVTKAATKKDIASSYNRFKTFNGKQYTGMTIGRGHKWNYDPGVWIDKKITPDKWTISFEVAKRRKGKAPEGSGAAVGTEYHWYILAHQFVKKLDANTYSTEMNGLKFKIAHKRAGQDKWNISDKTQRNHLIKILQDFIKELEAETIEEFLAQEHPPAKPEKKPAIKRTRTDRKAIPAAKKATKTTRKAVVA
jgi:hypothetical protein